MADAAALRSVVDDLAAEHDDLQGLVGDLALDRWDLPTPAEGWAIRDQISHLAFFDDAARQAVVDPDGFTAMAEAAVAAMVSGEDPMAVHLAAGRAMDPEALLAWWDRARGEFLQAMEGVDPDRRIPWFGPPMGTLSFVSARLMETWAHGQDVADALGRMRRPTDRLRHIARLGVSARPFSYVVRGLEPPSTTVAVELAAPSGESWALRAGPPPAGHGPDGSVRGTALDFCLLVTQRRNRLDLDLQVQGDAAAEWLAIAQAFAGAPGTGRPPGS